MPSAHRILALVPPESLSRIRACAPPGIVVEAVTLAALVRTSWDLAGGFVVVDPQGWHAEALNAAAKRASECGARLVIYSSLTSAVCSCVNAAADFAVPEVILRETDDSYPALRAALLRKAASLPGLVLAELVTRFAKLPGPLAARFTSFFSWAPIPHYVSELCSLVKCSRKVLVSHLHKYGLADTQVVIEVARVARGYHYLEDGANVSVASALAYFGSVRAMGDAFNRTLGVAPARAAHHIDRRDVAAMLIRLALGGRAIR
jgi:hypothetical protein